MASKHVVVLSRLALPLVLGIAGCKGPGERVSLGSDQPSSPTGGDRNVAGGADPDGARSHSGGGTSSGGLGSGGAKPSGGSPETGGRDGMGGQPGTGGRPSTKGTSGAPSTGGSAPAEVGGADATGGSTEIDGGAPAGGSPAAGGSPPTGGVGSPDAGGSGALGGTSTGSGGDGTGPTAGAAGVTGSAPVLECWTSEDCMLKNDCCTCEGVPVAAGAAQPACDQACTDRPCSAFGPDVSVACYRGFCTLDVDCERYDLTCDDPEPACAPGMAPTVVDGCWGPCIDARECPSVPSFDYCAEGDLHVTASMLGATDHCVEVPSACAASPDCACLGEAVCWVVCVDHAPGEITCICPGC
jgi:hypothetical protein